MADRFWTTGEAAATLGLKLHLVDYACAQGRAGRIVYVGGRRALTAANVRQLARHFGKPCPPECREDGDEAANKPVVIVQRGRKS